uniref:Ig-like domain-containing protein n=1 Tax=Octopus bimaculoides TaxID=37653 RepID=A0A0L8GJJ7_OCTBM
MLKMLHRIYWALGHQQSLVCNVDANPPIIKTQWTKNGRTLQFNSDRLQLLANGTVVVSRVQNSDAGSYSCQASSSLGRGPSSLLVQVIVRGGYLLASSLTLHISNNTAQQKLC